MRTYRIPSEISTELKINKALYLFDLLFIIGLIVFRMIVLPFIHSSFTWYFTIFLVIFGGFMLIRPSGNPQKRMYHAIYYAMIRRKDAYSAIDYKGRENHDAT
ncbi:hypothetical protein BEP19_16810 [Ammoniphilus oxalaticus]|uniref:Uncharacterized protein n=1 Tax=Ammoniphilus oxalaticus TaxID=66863 RepID=A0A419SQ41_9BACL|nr:DUF5592 family protein [Ammoniphilus oxalaticus]RKD26498.1 hypothetical protein BEP19_16810 [Ammoniphilus oxalaticus]